MKYRVAVTGLGIVSALGVGADAVAESLRTGKSGVVADAERIALGFSSSLTGRIVEFSPRYPLARKNRKTMPDFAQWAHEAAMQAIAEANLAPEDLRNERTGVIFGCDSSSIAAIEQTDALLEKKDTASIGSGLVFRGMTSCISMNLNVILGTMGACWTISAACASGAHAVGQAADLIMLGRQDRVICGGAQEINWQSMCSFDGLGAFSMRLDAPEEASRPFDRDRDGLVPGGGAAVVLLERYDLAEKRGAVILGEIAGYGFSSDGENISVPGKTGIGRAMRMALDSAAMVPGSIDYLCAHATSTPLGDAAEAYNIIDLFGDRGAPVSSTKSLTGHELWMSGAAQVVYTTVMARHGFIAPNRNFCTPDAVTAKLDVVQETREKNIRAALCNSAGFGGTNACIALRF